MKRNLTILTLAAAVMITSVAAVMAEDEGGKSKENPKEIEWIRYDDGLTRAKESDKHVFINFTTSWCGFCKKMDKTTFADAEVIKMMHDYFVTVKVDGDSRDTLDIAGYKITERNLTRSEFSVGSYPTYFFLASDGKKLGAIRGYQTKGQLMQYLTYVAEKKYDTTQTPKGGK